jgi:hypothetical protein
MIKMNIYEIIAAMLGLNKKQASEIQQACLSDSNVGKNAMILSRIVMILQHFDIPTNMITLGEAFKNCSDFEMQENLTHGYNEYAMKHLMDNPGTRQYDVEKSKWNVLACAAPRPTDFGGMYNCRNLNNVGTPFVEIKPCDNFLEVIKKKLTLNEKGEVVVDDKFDSLPMYTRGNKPIIPNGVTLSLIAGNKRECIAIANYKNHDVYYSMNLYVVFIMNPCNELSVYVPVYGNPFKENGLAITALDVFDSEVIQSDIDYNKGEDILPSLENYFNDDLNKIAYDCGLELHVAEDVGRYTLSSLGTVTPTYPTKQNENGRYKIGTLVFNNDKETTIFKQSNGFYENSVGVFAQIDNSDATKVKKFCDYCSARSLLNNAFGKKFFEEKICDKYALNTETGKIILVHSI